MIQKVKIDKIFSNPSNPRTINKTKFKKLVKSIKEFPEMLKLRPIVVNNEMGILGGNMRYKACQEIGMPEVYIIKAENLTDKQMEQFVIKDNVGFGEWDWDILANSWDVSELKDWALDLPYEFISEPDANELTEDFEDKDAKITITFDNVTDLQKAEIDIQELLDRKYPKAYFSVNGGIL